MASEEDLEKLKNDQASHRQASRQNQELEPEDLEHKSTKEEKHKSTEEKLQEMTEAFKKERKARMKAEIERDEFQYLLAKRKGSVTPMNKGTSGSDDSPMTKLKKDNILAALSGD